MSSDFRLDTIIMHSIGNLDGKRFLDVACGLGKWGYAVKLGWSGFPKYSVGLDVWRQHLKFVKYYNVYDDVVLADAKHLPFKEKSFDVICACEFLLHVKKSDWSQVLSEIERVSNQSVVVSVPNLKVPLDPENPFEKDVSAWSVKDLRSFGYKVRGIGFQLGGHRIPNLCYVLSGLTYLPLFVRFAEIIIGTKEMRLDP